MFTTPSINARPTMSNRFELCCNLGSPVPAVRDRHNVTQGAHAESCDPLPFSGGRQSAFSTYPAHVRSIT